MKHELSVVTLTTTSVPPRRTTPPSAFTKCQPLVVSIRGAEIRPPPEQPTTQAAPRRTADIFFCGSVTLDWATDTGPLGTGLKSVLKAQHQLPTRPSQCPEGPYTLDFRTLSGCLRWQRLWAY